MSIYMIHTSSSRLVGHTSHVSVPPLACITKVLEHFQFLEAFQSKPQHPPIVLLCTLFLLFPVRRTSTDNPRW